mmetsp:Transcript_16760/g.14686  ORF Transcript_16760/g.14686 Transcript_16760/m.14686 type:complete len:104 (+) Transcript_16760:978-1289(+)
MIGYGYAAWIIVDAMWDDMTLLMNPYPFFCSFGLPIFMMTFFMSFIYIILIMQGRNKKIQASITKFELNNQKRYEGKKENVSAKFKRLFLFFFCDKIPESRLH